MQWYYSRGGQQAGPVTVEELRGLLTNGQVAPTDLVWTEGMANWQPAGQVPALQAPAQPVPAPPGVATWYYSRAGQRSGPMTLEALRGMAASGQLVWTEGMTDWLPAAQVPAIGVHGGAVPQPLGYYQPPIGLQPSEKTKCVWALVCGIVSLLCCGVLLGPVALALGLMALSGMKRHGNQDGRGMAIAGVVLGIIGTVGGIVVIILQVAGVMRSPLGF
jgi:hypothetical protein